MEDDKDFPTPPKRVVQDDSREHLLANLLQLQRATSRTGSDARDEFGNPYELKTVTTRNVTTGRDIGPAYLDRLRSSYFVVAHGENTDYGFRISTIYFLAPEMMDDWISKIAARLSGDQGLIERAIDTLRRSPDFDEEQLERIRGLGYRGFTINNPKIPWSYVETKGIRLEGNPALHLRELIRQFPLPGANL